MFISRFAMARKCIVSASERDKFNSSLRNCTNGISYSQVLDLHGQGFEGCNKVDVLFNTKSSEKGCNFYVSSNSLHQCFILMFASKPQIERPLASHVHQQLIDLDHISAEKMMIE